MQIFAIILGLIAGMLFGIATPLSKITLSHLNSFQLAGLLYLGASLAFLPYIIINRSKQLRLLSSIGKKRHLIGIIIFGGLLGPLVLMIGLKSANSMSVSIWLNMELVATALLGFFVFKESLGKYAIIGICLTLASSILICWQENTSGIISGLFIVLACICWGIDNHLTAIIDGITPQTTTFIKGLVGGTINLCIGMLLSGRNIEIQYIGIGLLIGIFSYGISIFLYVTSAQNLGATRSQILFSSSTFWGLIAAYIFLGEKINLITIIAFTLLFTGIIFSSKLAHKHIHTHNAMVHIHMHTHDDEHHAHSHGEDFDIHTKHSHVHEHEEIIHEHSHYPDMHHRHEHQ